MLVGLSNLLLVRVSVLQIQIQCLTYSSSDCLTCYFIVGNQLPLDVLLLLFIRDAPGIEHHAGLGGVQPDRYFL